NSSRRHRYETFKLLAADQERGQNQQRFSAEVIPLN
ncbi:hypothetical protein SOVF_172000 isoform B, partial [Spinacia oleracea]